MSIDNTITITLSEEAPIKPRTIKLDYLSAKNVVATLVFAGFTGKKEGFGITRFRANGIAHEPIVLIPSDQRVHTNMQTWFITVPKGVYTKGDLLQWIADFPNTLR